jgi:phage shock protein A
VANFQVIFSGNEDELSRFVLAWKMASEIKRYDELKSQIEELEKTVKELRDKRLELENERMKLQREVAELTALKESMRRELTVHREG